MHVPAPGARAPPDSKYYQSAQHGSVGNALRAPTAISTARAAASPMAPRPKGKWPPQSHDFAHDSIPPAQPRVKQEERESALHAPREQWQPSAYGDPPTSYTLPPRPSFSSSSRISTTVPPSPTFSTRSTHPSATSLYPEPEHGADVHDRLELGGHTSGLSAREKELAQELVHRGVYAPSRSARRCRARSLVGDPSVTANHRG